MSSSESHLPPHAAFSAAVDGRYRIERELGAGGMATVYLAHDVRHDRKVAVKVLHPELAAAIGAERFLSEIRTTARLQHPHILPLLDSGEVADARDGPNGRLLYYVMPFVTGETLRARLERERQLPIADALGIAREVADALSYAHGHGIVHRDIKPENVLLQDDHALVADFGIALAIQQAGAQRMTQTGLSLGTPQYMSPEQAMGEKSVDHRTDIYALGAVTYEMLTGEPPFTGPTVQAIVAKLLTDEPRPPRALRRSVPPGVDAAVLHALEKLPADRMASARDFAAALDGDGPSPKRVATPARPTRARRVEPRTLALSALGLGALALAGWQSLAARRVRPQPSIHFSIDIPSDLYITARELTAASVAVTPDGRTIAFVARGRDGVRHLMVRAVDDDKARTVPGTEGASQPLFSPDGQWLAFWAAGRLQMVALSGGAPQVITDIPEPAGAAWPSPDTMVVTQYGRLLVVSPTARTVRPLSAPDTTQSETAQMYPVSAGDGKHVLYSSWGHGGAEGVKIGVMSLATGRSRILDVAAVSALGMLDGSLIAVTGNNNIIAVPVDLSGGRVTGTPQPVASGVAVSAARVGKAALSAAGTLAYVSGARESELVLVDSAGGRRTLLAERRTYGFPRYSPDGRRIALTIAAAGSSDIWIYDIAAGTMSRLTSGGAANERPEWTPDGSRILFRTDRARQVATACCSSIWWQPVDGSGAATPLLLSATAPAFEAVVTPDGKGVVYQVDTASSDLEYRALSGDTIPKRVAATPAYEEAPRLSPDGRWLAYSTDESGMYEVVVQPFPGPGARVQVSTNGGTEPVWSRDGRRVFYRTGRRVVAATLTTSPQLGVASRAELFDDVFLPTTSPHANYDVAPDGSHLLFLAGVDDQRLMVYYNWAAELRTRLRAPGGR
jgi:serine/threonine protein kinase/Tol biopolymer transport system component